MNSLTKKLSLVLMTLFLLIGILLAVITRHATEQYNLEITQRLNGSIAMYVAAEEQLIKDGRHNEAAISRLAERAMVINPTVEVYLLNNEGLILSHNLPPGTSLEDRIPLSQINTFLQPDSHRPLVNLDPRSPENKKTFSAAKVTYNGKDEGYVYVILGGQTYEALASDISKNWVLKVALASIVAVLLLSFFIGVLVVNQLTKPLTQLTKKVQKFQLQMTGNEATETISGDEISILKSTFEQMQKRIEFQMNQIKSADQNRRDLISNVSHDLRTPLASIQGYLDTLNIKKDQLEGSQREAYIATASKHCIRLNGLINDLFELSKLDSFAIKPSIEAYSMAELIQDVSMEFKLLAEQRNIDLKVDLPAGNTTVKADIGLMQRVLENLLSNAIKHTPKNGQVLLKLVKSGAQFKVIIRDTGRGISEAELPHIFNRLYRAENSSHSDHNSTGLGLAIVKKIMDIHKTKIKVISKLNQGTQFSFHLSASG